MRIGAGALVLGVLVGLLAMHVLAGSGAAGPSVTASHASMATAPGPATASSADRDASLGAHTAPPLFAAEPHWPSCAGDEAAGGAAVACFLALLLIAVALGAPARWPGLAAAAGVLRVSARRGEPTGPHRMPLRVLLCVSRT
ncbi:hypothetical protein [Agromyces mediolanus]|uniref:hypothetical protein n=1 Tax=Agromyces mediolanus TaxID=41986 RepID=UPI001E5BEB91|nr:hypothetical protein [Agromyces mediolanus]MCD1572323.1 hypothetical protein [Agromyces mediolanus]